MSGITNRHRAMIGKRGKHWCRTCDAELVGKIGKCPVCGSKANNKKRIMEKCMPIYDEDG